MPVSLSLISKNSGSTISTGEPMGLLLALTYGEDVNTGLEVTLIGKN